MNNRDYRFLVDAPILQSAVCLLLGLVLAVSADAQIVNYAETGSPPPAGLELLQEEPHDLIFFTPESGGGWLKARLLNLPGRKLPATPSGSLRFEVMGVEAQEFTAKWKEIAKVDLWEIRIEREATERINSGDFVGAYPFLSILIRDYPNRRGLRELRSEFLWKDASRRAIARELGPALAMLEELHAYAPEYRRSTVVAAIGAITDKLMSQLLERKRPETAQRMLARLETDYAGERLSSIDKWNQEFLRMATEKRNEAIAAARKKDYRSARKLARESIYLKPDIEGGVELVRKIDEIYPLVNVGVLQSATLLEPTRLDNWGARRSGRLIYRTLFEMQGAGAEGGEYEFLFGSTEQSPDRKAFNMYLETERLEEPFSRVDGFFLADRLAERAQIESDIYFSPWAAAVEGIGLSGPRELNCLFRRPNILPSCLLQIRVDGSWFGGEVDSPTGDYKRDLIEDEMVRYVLKGSPRTETQPREIVENRYLTATDAVAALVQGEVDVIDQLFPADAVRLETSKRVVVEKYPLPTVHMLVPCSDHLFLSERTFRRALVYGTNREDILSGELLEGNKVEGCRVISGPFPAGIELNDPLGYAYDKSIYPRKYEPRLAKLLMTMNMNQLVSAAEQKKEELPVMETIRLAHPADNLSRVACEAIKSQWNLLELPVELVELPVGSSFPEEGTADLVYVSAAVWEPIIDARRVLGPRGLAGSTDQLVGLGLRRLEESKNWREARDRLLDLHGITNHELPIIPLWQLVDSYAYRKELLGIGTDIVTLYQNASKWRLKQ